MEEWREELNRALASGLQGDDKYKDFEDEFFLQMATLFSNEVDSDGFSTGFADGSRVGRAYLFRDRKLNDVVLFHDYFSNTLTYGPVKFRRRYKMRRDLFCHIVDSIAKYVPWFV